MKKISIALLGLALAHPAFGADDKVTFEKGFESHKRNMHGKTITPEETIATWNLYVSKPTNSSSGSGELENVWRGKATQVTNQWGTGAFMFELGDPYVSSRKTVATLWLNLNGDGLDKQSGANSDYGYEKSWYIQYDDSANKFVARGIKESTPNILSISKLAQTVKQDCTHGAVKKQTTGCAAGYTCETGLSQSVCQSGVWGDWQVVTRPQCAGNAAMCR